MAEPRSENVRVVGLIGPAGTGKTTLLEAMLLAAGAIPRRGDVTAGTSVGDASPEARQRGQSVEPNLVGFEWLGERIGVIDCPGSSDFSAAADAVTRMVDLAIVVADPLPERAVFLQPILRELEAREVPHAIFVNKIDQAQGSIEALIGAMQSASATPLVPRQLLLFDAERAKGFVDLALERAFLYRPGQASARVDVPDEITDAETQARFQMLEQLSNFDDGLLEQLLNDETPSLETIFSDLAIDVRQGKITPVFFGSALQSFGVRRLLKAVRHEAPGPDAAATRLGVDGRCAYVFGVSHAGHAGKLAYARVFGGEMQDGAALTLPDGSSSRIGGLFQFNGGAMRKASSAPVGDIVAIGKIDAAQSGDILAADGRARKSPPLARRPTVYAISVEPKDRKDDVRLSTALTKLLEEDGSLRLRRDAASQQTLLEGQGEPHLQITLDRLRRRFGLEVTTGRPAVGYRESIRKSVTQRGRHKKQTGGHGQFADVLVEIRPGERGTGFTFSQKITGGAVPKQWIPAVEQGLKEAMERGPLGFPVIDVAATLIDGAFHSVDSSEMAFRTAGRIAMNEGLKSCASYLLEPIEKLTIAAPIASASRVTAAVVARRGQILGLAPKPGWSGWEQVEVYLPEAQLQDFISELRGVTQGLGSFEASFDHMAEVTGRPAEEVVRQQGATA
ncbi:MAG: elongation factor G [Caulobacteraceae bacterium]|nr:elongation factor G [Caulobacteraceae bacterium]